MFPCHRDSIGWGEKPIHPFPPLQKCCNTFLKVKSYASSHATVSLCFLNTPLGLHNSVYVTAHRNALLKGTKTVISLLSHSAACTVYHKYTYAST